jgi:hypothetical protein
LLVLASVASFVSAVLRCDGINEPSQVAQSPIDIFKRLNGAGMIIRSIVAAINAAAIATEISVATIPKRAIIARVT